MRSSSSVNKYTLPVKCTTEKTQFSQIFILQTKKYENTPKNNSKLWISAALLKPSECTTQNLTSRGQGAYLFQELGRGKALVVI